MILHDNGEVVTRGDSDDSMPSLKNVSDDGIEYPVEGESLVTRHALNSQIKKDDIEQQR